MSEAFDTSMGAERLRGKRVPVGWWNKLKSSQEVRTIEFEGREYPRIPFGEETRVLASTPSGDQVEGSDCCKACLARARSELHVSHCPAEECPICHESLRRCLHRDRSHAPQDTSALRGRGALRVRVRPLDPPPPSAETLRQLVTASQLVKENQ